MRVRPKTLCGERTTGGVNPNPCWRLQDHHGKHVNQRYRVPADRPLAVVAADGVLVATYRAFQIETAKDYIRRSGGHAVDVRDWSVKA